MNVVVTVHAPGRVNLIGDHTDYAGGLALPCAIDLGITIRGHQIPEHIAMTSETESDAIALRLDELLTDDRQPNEPFPIDELHPQWGRYVAAVAQEVGARTGFDGAISSTLPAGAGLSSSAALEIAVALALGFSGDSTELALLGQRAEHRAVGVPCGLLDQLSIAEGRAGHAMLIDFTERTRTQIPVPDHLDLVVVHSREPRRLADSHYGERRASCELAAQRIGPLAGARLEDVKDLEGPHMKRARHVITECARVQQAALALESDEPELLGELMTQSHASLRDDFEVSTPTLDTLVERLTRIDGVFGARLTGAGFGGCVIAVCERDAIADPEEFTGRGWLVRPSDGARLVD